MRNFLNFIKEDTLLQSIAWNIGDCRDHIIVNWTPECHPELYSGGIEYSWGFENNYYRRLSLDKKKGEFCFSKIVKETISIYNLTANWVCVFSRRACEYIIAYNLMIHWKTLVSIDIDLSTHTSVERIYNMFTYFKTHRCSLDFLPQPYCKRNK